MLRTWTLAIPDDLGQKLDQLRIHLGERSRSSFISKLLRHAIEQTEIDQRVVKKYKPLFDKIARLEEQRANRLLKAQRRTFQTR
ncbi:MAG: hypothetical protein HY747_03085 [Elusimicrobia bacterium]|nr:hypothetical protein [Elusimicrobiota bacterium]